MSELAGKSVGPAPMLVLLPGLDGTGKLFSEILKALEGRVATRIIDYPKDVPLGYDELEVLVRAVLPDDRPFVLLGESFSGPLAIRIAARPPSGFSGLILCVTFARNPYPWAAWLGPLAAYLPLKSFPRWLRAPLMWGSNDPNRAPSQTQRAMAGVSVGVVRRRIAALLAVDETHALRKVTKPVLVLRAKRDRVVPKSAAERIMREAPHARRVEVDGPHLLLQTRPAECATAIESFMRELG
jgi:pimeloyl-[acyl-carrier protein] methyl ester esterase